MKTLKGKIKPSPIKTWIDKSVIDQSLSPVFANKVKSKTRQTINSKDISHKFLYRVTPLTRLRNEVATKEFLNNQIKNGFNPKWYIVFHLHRPPFSYEDPKFEKNLKVIRDNLFSLIYGLNWKRKTKRARAIFGIELGDKKDRPHINLLIEDLPKHVDVKYAFNFDLPKRVKCVWMKSAKVQDYYSQNLHGYISKENHLEFPTINYSISDKIKCDITN